MAKRTQKKADADDLCGFDIGRKSAKFFSEILLNIWQ